MSVARKILMAAGLAALMAVTSAQAQLYRWTDEQGRTHYSDTPPPEAARQERRVLDDRGITVRTLDRALTEEELEQRRQAEASAEAERQVREEQERRDRVLLQSFGSERELITARDDRVALIDSTLNITQDKIRSLEEQKSRLEERRNRLASQDREVPAALTEDIASLERQLDIQERFRDDRAAERQRLMEQFNADLERLRELQAADR